MTLGAYAKPSAGPPVLLSNDLVIQADTTILWNGKKVDFDTFDRICKKIARQKPQPEIHLNTEGQARYDVVAKVVAHIQKNCPVFIGFTGIDSGK